MNRQQRRAAQRRRQKENKFYDQYLKHLPQTDQPARGRLTHVVMFHDEWCQIHRGGTCNCSPDVELREEPDRS